MSTMTNYADVATSTPPAQRESHIQQATVQLERALETLHKSCAEMEARLGPLLRREPEAAETAKGQSQPTLVPLATNIAGYATQVNAAVDTLQSILRRLEL